MISLGETNARQDSAAYAEVISRNAVNISAYVLTVLVVGLDLCLNQNLAVLFAIPLLIFGGRVKRSDQIWKYVALFIVTTYLVYFIKFSIIIPDSQFPLISFRLFNRTFVAIMLALLGIATQAWLYWQHERTLLDYFERNDEDEVNATTGIIACLGLGLLITALDFVSPANFNLPILFTVPLYLSSWMRSSKVLWMTCAALIALTVVGIHLTPAALPAVPQSAMVMSRAIVISALVLMAMLLQLQLVWTKDEDRNS